MTKEERAAREAVESVIKGEADQLKPPEYLTEEQKEIFEYILKQLDESKLLGNLDIFILAQTAVAIDTIQEMNKKLNEDRELILYPSYRQAKAEVSKEFFRCCNELCLSPQSRAKISISAAKPDDKKKTIMDLINEDDEEED